MEESKDGIAVEEKMAVNDNIDLGKSKTDDPEDFRNHLPEPELTRNIGLANYQKNAAACKELRNKLRCMLAENSADLEEKSRLHHKVQNYIKLESERRTVHDLIMMNRQCSQLKKVWINRGLPVDRESLQSAATSKDAFDMSSLSESLPSTPHESEDEFVNKAKKLTKEFLSIIELKRQALKRSEMVSVPASNTSELYNNLASCSYKVRQPNTLSHMVKKVCGDKKNFCIFSLRPLTRMQKGPDGSSNSSTDREIISVPEFQEFANNCKEQKNAETQNLDGESRLQNIQTLGIDFHFKSPQEGTPKCFKLFRRCLERRSRVTQRLQQLRNSVLLDRQMSRLKISNSRRAEVQSESEIEGSSSDQISDEQDKARRENRSRAICQKLKEVLRRFREARSAEEMKFAKEM